MTSAQCGPSALPVDPDSTEHLPRPRLGPTFRVVGRFETPPEVKGNPPDMPLLGDARRVLGYKTNYTLLEWWDIFPVGKWWRYAIQSTKHFSTSFNYHYFLKCLLSAAHQDKIYQDCVKKLKHLAKVDVAREMYRERPAPRVCRVCNGANSACEECDPVLVKIRQQVSYLAPVECPPVEAGGCGGKVCYRCARAYLGQMKQPAPGDKPRLQVNWGSPAPVPS